MIRRVLLIEDDGIGLDEEHRKDPGSLGLIGMEERARFIAAHFAAGRGTRVLVDLPIRAAAGVGAQ